MVNLFQLNPECLAILSVVYRFVKGGYRSWQVWPSLRKEMRTVMGVIFLLEIDLGAQFSQDVYCGDSSGEGFAVHVTKAEPGGLREAWRWREKWRYRRVYEVPDLPMEFDTSDFYATGGHPGRGWAPRQRSVEDCSVGANSSRRGTCAAPMKAKKFWCRAPCRRWTHMKEGRVALAGLRRQSRSVKCVGQRVLTLSDNLSCIGAFEKGRSSSQLLTVCRRACGYRLACESQWRLRYIESERNPSDADSRWCQGPLVRRALGSVEPRGELLPRRSGGSQAKAREALLAGLVRASRPRGPSLGVLGTRSWTRE